MWQSRRQRFVFETKVRLRESVIRCLWLKELPWVHKLKRLQFSVPSPRRSAGRGQFPAAGWTAARWPRPVVTFPYADDFFLSYASSRRGSCWQYRIAVTCRLTRVLCRSMLRGLFHRSCLRTWELHAHFYWRLQIRCRRRIWSYLPWSYSMRQSTPLYINFYRRAVGHFSSDKISFYLGCWGFCYFFWLQSSLPVLEDFNNAHPIVSDIFNWLVLAARRGHIISFCWIPAHVSVKGNEEADELAKTGASRQVTACPVQHRDLFPIIRAAVHVVWQERWNANRATSKMGAITARAMSPWSYAHVQDRCRETALARLRTGHTRLTHGFLMSQGVEPYCNACLVSLTVRHLLVECPSLRELREQCLAQCRGRDGSFSLSLSLALVEEALSPGHEVLKFLQKSGFLYLL